MEGALSDKALVIFYATIFKIEKSEGMNVYSCENITRKWKSF